MNIDRLSDLIHAGGAGGVSSGLDSVVSGVTSAVQAAGTDGLRDALLPIDPRDLEIPARPGSIGDEAGYVGPAEYLRLAATSPEGMATAHRLSRDALAALDTVGSAFAPLDELRGSWLNAAQAGPVVDKLVGPRGLLTPLTGGTEVDSALPGKTAEPGKLLDLDQLGVKVRDVADESAENRRVLSDLGPYVRELASEKAGRKLFPADGAPYVKEVSDQRAVDQGIILEAGPYVRELASEKAGRKLFPADGAPYVKEVSDQRAVDQGIILEAGPYVRELASEKAGRKLFPADGAPYVKEVSDQQAMDHGIALEAGPYVRQLAEVWEGTKCVLPDAGPYVRELSEARSALDSAREPGVASVTGGGWPGGIDESLQDLARMDPFTPDGVGKLARLSYQLGALDGLQRVVGNLLSLDERLDIRRGDREV
ncbi:MAG TPA: hypothetical protein PLN26_07365 [Acidobacteriota bacterium]|mgnify:CR=1 FL=1|nr:hypothetical protein [Acidobacteriota bacterium]HQG91598.1 hypothetical protein [Acidobacteriota bacterium]